MPKLFLWLLLIPALAQAELEVWVLPAPMVTEKVAPDGELRRWHVDYAAIDAPANLVRNAGIARTNKSARSYGAWGWDLGLSGVRGDNERGLQTGLAFGPEFYLGERWVLGSQLNLGLGGWHSLIEETVITSHREIETWAWHLDYGVAANLQYHWSNGRWTLLPFAGIAASGSRSTRYTQTRTRLCTPSCSEVYWSTEAVQAGLETGGQLGLAWQTGGWSLLAMAYKGADHQAYRLQLAWLP